MNMLKLVEEMRGLDDFANRRMPARNQGVLSLPMRLPLKRNIPPRRKVLIPISMLAGPDIPSAVDIRFASPPAPK
jgi:hypothetical protein